MQAAEDVLPEKQEQDEVDLIDFLVPIPGAGKGAAEELLIDLDYGESSTNLDPDLMNLQGFRFQSHLNKEGYLETSLLDINSLELNEPILQTGVRSMDMETSLLDINSPELNEPILQTGVRSMDTETSLLDVNSPELNEPFLQPE